MVEIIPASKDPFGPPPCCSILLPVSASYAGTGDLTLLCGICVAINIGELLLQHGVEKAAIMLARRTSWFQILPPQTGRW